MSVPVVGPLVENRGGPITRAIGRWGLRLLGWKVAGAFPNMAKYVVIGAPHSSNFDFFVAVFTIMATDLRIRILGKHTLFIGPLGPIMRWFDILPVDRSAPHGVVGECVAAFQNNDQMVIGVAPEGTRNPKPGSGWKTGFWHIARQAGVPIIPVALDYANKTMRIGDPIATSDSLERDFALISAFYAGVKGAKRTLTDTIPLRAQDRTGGGGAAS